MTGTHLERVAQAIADNLASQSEVADMPDRYVDWIDPDELAAAAVDALRLPVRWGVGIVQDGQVLDVNANQFWTEEEAEEFLPSINAIYPDDRRRVVSRFDSGPWVVQPEAASDE